MAASKDLLGSLSMLSAQGLWRLSVGCPVNGGSSSCWYSPSVDQVGAEKNHCRPVLILPNRPVVWPCVYACGSVVGAREGVSALLGIEP